MPFRPIQTISGFTEYGVTEVWAIHYENKRERASSTERKLVLLYSQNGVTSRASITPLAYVHSDVLCTWVLRVGYHDRDNFSIGGLDLQRLAFIKELQEG